MGLILPWCGAIAACWQLQKSPHESLPEGGASIRPHYDPTTAITHYLGIQNGKWYHGTVGRVTLSTLARITPREVHSIAIFAHFPNCLTPYHPQRAIM